MNGVQCYGLFRGIALKNHAFFLPLLFHTITHHSFDDDLQLQMSAPHDKISELLHSMQSCTVMSNLGQL